MRSLKPLPPIPEQKTLGDWVDSIATNAKPKQKRARTARSSSGYTLAIAEASERAKQGNWEGAEPRHMVGLYAALHQQVYGVAPDELKDVWRGAVTSAKSMLEKEFDNDPRKMIEFIRWTWARERRREEKRRADKQEGSRIGWVLQFKHRSMLTDYRVEVARAEEVAKPRAKR